MSNELKVLETFDEMTAVSEILHKVSHGSRNHCSVSWSKSDRGYHFQFTLNEISVDFEIITDTSTFLFGVHKCGLPLLEDILSSYVGYDGDQAIMTARRMLGVQG